MSENQDPANGTNDDARIVVVCDGNSPIPKFVDFNAVSPFHLIAIGEWLSLKGRQMIVMAEQAELSTGKDSGIVVPGVDPDTVAQILGISKS